MDRSKSEQKALPEALKEKIPVLRRKHGDLFLFQADGAAFAYRALTLNEIFLVKEFSEKDLTEKAEEIALGAILYPDDPSTILDDLPGGVADRLFDAIIASSNVPDIKTLERLLHEARLKAQESISMMVSWVVAAFPGYTEEMCYAMSQRELIRRAAMAEFIIGRPLQFAPPPSEKPKRRGFGMMDPAQMPSEAAPASKAMPAPPVQSAPPGAKQAFDFAAENRAMGFGPKDQFLHGAF